jgi:hypothetical protein
MRRLVRGVDIGCIVGIKIDLGAYYER